MLAGDDSGPCMHVRGPQPPLPPKQLVEAGRASSREKRDHPTRRKRLVQPLHGQPADALTLALRISRHGFDVSDSAPWLVAKADQPRNSAGMADEMVAVTYQHVHTTVGVVGGIVVEAVAERPVPQPAQGLAGRRVSLVTLEHGDVHNPHPNSEIVPWHAHRHDRADRGLTGRPCLALWLAVCESAAGNLLRSRPRCRTRRPRRRDRSLAAGVGPVSRGAPCPSCGLCPRP